MVEQGLYFFYISFKPIMLYFLHSERLSIVKPPKLNIVKLKQIATMTCEAVGNEPISYEWRKNGRLLNAVENKIFISKTAITLFDVEKGDEAVYQCIAKNKFHEVQASARLVVDCKLCYLLC